MVYFDYAAATPLDQKTKEILASSLDDLWYNPSARYRPARATRERLEEARSVTAQCLGVKSNEIIFTAGGTEANNIAIQGVMADSMNANCVVLSTDHKSALGPASLFEHRLAPVDTGGVVKLSQLEDLIDDNTRLVSLAYANNEIGVVQPIRKIKTLLNKIRADRKTRSINVPIYLHLDACQAANYLSIKVETLGCDLMTLNGGKIYGLKQSGCLYVRAGIELKPLIVGGDQEHGLRAGTENVTASIAFATMLQTVLKDQKNESKRLNDLRLQLIATLSQNIHFSYNGDQSNRLPNIINIKLDDYTGGERLVYELDARGIYLSSGSACTASSDQPSHVLKAMGMSDEQAGKSIRVSMGRQTTSSDISALATALSDISNR